MSFTLPLNQCVMLAERRLSDAGWALTMKNRELAEDLKYQAREFYRLAASQGWEGNIEGCIRHFMALYGPQS